MKIFTIKKLKYFCYYADVYILTFLYFFLQMKYCILSHLYTTHGHTKTITWDKGSQTEPHFTWLSKKPLEPLVYS